jgi:hypothetical protein
MRSRPAGARPGTVLTRLLVGVIALVAVVSTACTSDGGDEPPNQNQLDRIDQPAQVDQDRLGGQPGAVNDDESGG